MIGTQLIGIQLLQLELRLRKTPSRSLRPLKSADIFLQFYASCSFRVPFALDRLILDKEKLNGSNFLDWYHYLRIVLRNEQKLHHLEEALPEAPPATVITDVCNAYTRRVAEEQEVACLMLVSVTPEIQKNLEDRTDKCQSVRSYVLKMKAYLDQMERLGYPIHLVLGVDLILTSLSKDYDRFMPNYNMHGMRKTIPELHAMLKLAEKGKKKGEGKSKLAYDPGHKIPLLKRSILLRTQSVITVTRLDTREETGLRGIQKMNKGALDLYVGNGNCAAVEAIWSFDLILPSETKGIAKLQQDGLFESTDDESFGVCVSCISGNMARKPFSHASERVDDLLGLIHSDGCEALVKREPLNKLESRSIKCIFVGYPKEMMGYYFYYPTKNKIFVARYVEFSESNLISQEASGSLLDFDEIQREDTQPSDNTIEHQYPESKKWHEAMNVKMQSIKDNQVWILVDLPPDYKTVGSKWLFKKKTDMDGNIHTYKARLVAKDMFLIYGGDSITKPSVTCYTNTSWETDQDDLRSQTRYVLMMNEGAVNWKSSKQSTTVMYYMKVEYIVASKVVMEAIWIHKFIYGLGFVPNNDRPVNRYYENAGAITIAD
nr:zinc finger, CCHC-type [Tanacetum cinerariifolium]GEX61598.1 zinc finger, CCHC-type [Tanacetum cinerariifolium]